MIDFAMPGFALLLPLPLIAYFALPRATSTNSAALRAPFLGRLQRLQQGYTRKKQQSFLLKLLAILIWLLFILAAMRPQWLDDPIPLPQNARNMMLAIDISGSMQQEDFDEQGRGQTRLDVVKQLVDAFIKKRQGDRIGLILFGAQAYIQSPLSFDLKTVQKLLDEAQIGLAGKETAIGDAIGQAVKRYQNNPQDEDRVLILISDGANTSGEVPPAKAAALAAEAGLKIYTIGIGADSMLVRGLLGTRRINPSADLDEKMLTLIADQTGGKYFRAKNRADLEEIYALLDQLEPQEDDQQFFRPVTALYIWPLACGLLLTLVLSALMTRAQSSQTGQQTT